jgi:hypothetical protein
LGCLLLVAAAAANAGGDVSPVSAPSSGVADISGLWRGTSDSNRNHVYSRDPITVSIDQDDRRVAGMIAFTSTAQREWSGTLSGTLAGAAPDTQFVGTIELRTPSAGGACIGRAVFSGRSAEDGLLWMTSRFDFVSNPEERRTPSCADEWRHVAVSLGRD